MYSEVIADNDAFGGSGRALSLKFFLDWFGEPLLGSGDGEGSSLIAIFVVTGGGEVLAAFWDAFEAMSSLSGISCCF